MSFKNSENISNLYLQKVGKIACSISVTLAGSGNKVGKYGKLFEMSLKVSSIYILEHCYLKTKALLVSDTVKIDTVGQVR